MQIMAQNCKSLVNSDYINQIYIEETARGIKLMAAAEAEENIILGTYDKLEHAEKVLAFIGVCMADEAAHSRITQIPTREDMEINDTLASSGPNPGGLKKLLKRAISLWSRKS